jgi:hypothetical protein
MSPQAKRRRKRMAHSTVDRLVGSFIGRWNLLEDELNDVIASLCKMDTTRGTIITANLNFQTKMHIIRTMVHFLGAGKPPTWNESAVETLGKIQGINENWRILVAHNIAVAMDMKTVKFLKVSAKRKLDFPDIRKSKDEFRQVGAEIFRRIDEIRKIAEDLSRVSTNSLASAIASAPTEPWKTLDQLGYPPLLAPAIPRSPSEIATGGILGGRTSAARPKEDKA